MKYSVFWIWNMKLGWSGVSIKGGNKLKVQDMNWKFSKKKGREREWFIKMKELNNHYYSRDGKNTNLIIEAKWK